MVGKMAGWGKGQAMLGNGKRREREFQKRGRWSVVLDFALRT